MKLLLTLVAALVTFSAACGSGPFGRGGADATPGAGDATLRTVADVPLPGDTSRWDYQSLDPQSHRLFIAHLGASEVVVYDTERAAVIGTIRGIAGVHGVLAVPELRRVYASATDAQRITIIDSDSLTVVAMVGASGYPDGLAYVGEVGKIYVSDERDGNEAIIDARTNASVGSVGVGGEAGNTQYDAVSHRVYVAVQTKNQIVEIDPATDQIRARYDTPGCEHPHGLLIDSPQRRAFVACQGNNKLVVLDMSTMQVISSQEVGNGPDVLAMDANLQLVYVAAENGPLAIFRSDSSGVRRIAFQSAGPNAHSVAVDETSHHLFLPLANVNGRPVLREVAVELPPQS